MKKLLALALGALLLFTACQTTPEADIVVQKNTEQMIEAAKELPATPEIELLLRERTGAPEALSFTTESADLKLRLRVQAAVECPDIAAMPVARVIPADFDEALVKRLFDALCAGHTLYDVNRRLSKKEIEQQIVSWEQVRESPDYADIPAGESVIDLWITQLEKEYPKAPEIAERKQVDGTLYAIPIADPNGKIHATFMGIEARDGDGGDYIEFIARNNYGLKESVVYELPGGGSWALRAQWGANLRFVNSAVYRDNWVWRQVVRITDESAAPQEALGTLTRTPLQARSQADALLSGTGMRLADMYLFTDAAEGGARETAHYGYMLHYAREVNGATCAIADGVARGDKKGERFAPSWYYEKLSVLITDDGIMELAWRSPMTVTELVVDDAKLMPFSEAEAVFEKMMLVVYTGYANSPGIKSVALEVDRIALALQRISEPNNLQAGLLVPAWHFYGQILTETDDGEKCRLQTGSDCLLVVNAIDGSVIDPELGY